jgi:hypothetical protein
LFCLYSPDHLWKNRYAIIRRMHAAGVKLVVRSGQGSAGTQIDELPLLMEFLTIQVHIPAAVVLRGVTGLAAEALGLADHVGTLEPGKRDGRLRSHASRSAASVTLGYDPWSLRSEPTVF